MIISCDPNELLCSGTDNETIKIWNFQTGTVLNTLIGHTPNLRALALI